MGKTNIQFLVALVPNEISERQLGAARAITDALVSLIELRGAYTRYIQSEIFEDGTEEQLEAIAVGVAMPAR